MGVFDKFNDSPNKIKKEGQEITIRFQRTGPTTGRVSWNIPAPAAGCASDASQAYNGIVITISSKPSNYLSNAPKNAVYYTGDATGDADMHAGDKLDGAMVIGAFYDDKTTTFLDVNDVLPKTPYYVSGYAVDAQGRYHREGVHAYSLPTGSEEWGLPDKAATHDIIIDVVGGVQGSTSTGLAVDTEYTLKLLVNKKEYSVVVDGENACTYSDLIRELKEKLAVLGDVYSSPISPNTNRLYLNRDTGVLSRWDGEKYVDVDVLSYMHSPDLVEDDLVEDVSYDTPLWLNRTTGKLSRSTVGSGWVEAPYVKAAMDPASPSCNQLVFDVVNQDVWMFKSTHWVKLKTYKQDTNPMLAVPLTCDHYWYNPADGSVSVWNVDVKKWDAVNIIYSTIDPRGSVDYLWYDEVEGLVKSLSGSAWSAVPTVSYETSIPETITLAAARNYASDNKQYIYAAGELRSIEHSAIAHPIIHYPEAPDNASGGLWLSDGVMKEYVGGEWIDASVAIVPVFSSIGSDIIGAAQGNDYIFAQDTEVLYRVEGNTLVEHLYTNFKNDTDSLLVSFWYDPETLTVKGYNGSEWSNVIVVMGDSVSLAESVSDGTVLQQFPNSAYYYSVDTGEFHKIDTTLNEVDHISFDREPNSVSLWWNAAAGVDTILAWDERQVSNKWVPVTSFSQTASDPAAAPPAVEPNSAWYNPSTGEIKLLLKSSCRTIVPINLPGPPTNIPLGTIWHNTVTNEWKERIDFVVDGMNGSWKIVHAPMIRTNDPFDIDANANYYWLDIDENPDVDGKAPLKHATGSRAYGTLVWVEVDYDVTPFSNPVGRLWFDLTTDTLRIWNGTAWEEATGLVSVELIPPVNARGRSVLSFFTRENGCSSSVEILSEPGTLLTLLTQPVIYTDPVAGTDGLLGGSTYNQLGVGDDGSPDERRAIHDDIRTALGHPVVQVELTKEQLDLCINFALKELRKFSSYSYKRGVFFLDLKPNQQTYIMTNKCVGFNKVVGINSIHRARGISMNAASIDNDAFTYAAIQRLYTMGTFDMLSFHLVSAYMEEMETLFANRIMFHWHELERELNLHARISRKERVLVDAFFERTEQDLMVDRQTGLWLQRWALAEAKLMLSQSRGKFQSLPGPNGSTNLNAADLQNQAKDEMDQLRLQLEDGSMQNYSAIGLRAHFILG